MKKFTITATETVRDVVEAEDEISAEKMFRARYPATTRILSIDDGYYPPYVRIGDPPQGGSVLVLVRNGARKTYYRDAGQWECDVKMVDGKLLIYEPEGILAHLNNVQLFETTRNDWAKDNAGYVNDVLPVEESPEDADFIPF